MVVSAVQLNLNENILQTAIKYNKELELKSYISNLPKGLPTQTIIEFLNNLNVSELDSFFTILYSKNSVESIDKSDYNSLFGSKLFHLEPKGLGKAELFLAAIIKDSKISGGSQSYDLTVNMEMYEIKDYRRAASDAIRLGTKGKVTRFRFWNQILKTITILQDDFKYLNTEIDSVLKFKSRIEYIIAGELNRTDVKLCSQMYNDLHMYSLCNSDKYSIIKLYNVNGEPKYYYINSLKSNKNMELVMTVCDDLNRDNFYIKTQLKRILYVRNPEMYTEDLQYAVDSCIDKNMKFLIFRPSGPIITNDFKFSHVSQGGIYILEK